MKKSVLRKVEPYLWILPSIVLMAIFILIPIVFVFRMSVSKITKADQGQFSIEDRDQNTPYIKKVRVVTTVTYSLKD